MNRARLSCAVFISGHRCPLSYPASRVSFDLPRQIGKTNLLPLPDLSRKIEGDSARRVPLSMLRVLIHIDAQFQNV